MKGVFLFVVLVVGLGLVTSAEWTNPCCSYPCGNGGICTTRGYDDYQCDCAGLPYYGKHCEIPTWKEWFKSKIVPDKDSLHYITVNYGWFWGIINSIPWLHDFALSKVLQSRADLVDIPAPFGGMVGYPTVDTYFNHSTYVRVLPPIPENCPTQMGAKGPKVLPKPELIVKKLFTRTKFIPDAIGTSVLFPFFAQHFTHMFFKTVEHAGPEYTYGRHGVDVSNIYGADLDNEHKLREHKGGRLRMQVIKGETWPMFTSEVNITQLKWMGMERKVEFGLGHEFYNVLPGLTMFSTIYMREHNRICAILEKEHPEWTDEQLFQTTKLIILGEVIKVVIEDYVQHLSGYKFRLTFTPEALHGEPIQYQNRIFIEFNHLYRWHPLMPDNFEIGDAKYSIHDFFSKGGEILLKHGLSDFVAALSKQRAGQIGPRNHGQGATYVAQKTIEDSRKLRMMPFNEFRRKYRLEPYKSFIELTGNKELAKEMEELYGDIDAVEYFVGIMMEKRRPKALFGGTIIDVGGPFSLQGLFANPIGCPKYWKPSTFGGDVGFDIVKTASIEKLFCQNIKGECPYVGFILPGFDRDNDEGGARDEL